MGTSSAAYFTRREAKGLAVGGHLAARPTHRPGSPAADASADVTSASQNTSSLSLPSP